MRLFIIHFMLFLMVEQTIAMTYQVGKGFAFQKIQMAINQAKDQDTILVHEGIYQEGNLLIDTSLIIL